MIMNFARAGRSSPQNTSSMQRWLDEQNASIQAGMGTGARGGRYVAPNPSTPAPPTYQTNGVNAAFAAPVQAQQPPTDPSVPPSALPPATGPAPAVNEPMAPAAPTGQPSNPMASMAGLGALSWLNQPPAEEDQNYIFGQNNPLSAYALSTGMASRMRFR